MTHETEKDMSPLVSTAWLADHLGDPDLRIVDVRWKARYEKGRGISVDDREAYLAGHIPGAVFAAMLGELSDPQHPVSDMLVPAAQFERVMAGLGIGEHTTVVAYDDVPVPLGAARFWWALSYYGHKRVHVLDGGLRQWRREGRPISTETPDVAPALFAASPQPEWLATRQDVVEAIGQPGTVIMDCLSRELYRGEGDRHQWGERSGHVPGAVNVPFFANVDTALADAPAAERERIFASDRSLTFQPASGLRALYEGAGVTPDRQVIAYCGRGYAAACGLLALKVLGYPHARLYDGSWAEWGADPELPVEVGPQS